MTREEFEGTFAGEFYRSGVMFGTGLVVKAVGPFRVGKNMRASLGLFDAFQFLGGYHGVLLSDVHNYRMTGMLIGKVLNLRTVIGHRTINFAAACKKLGQRTTPTKPDRSAFLSSH